MKKETIVLWLAVAALSASASFAGLPPSSQTKEETLWQKVSEAAAIDIESRVTLTIADQFLTQYPYHAKAANVLEQSLTFQDDPDVHSKLAFLYSQLLHNRRKAEQHLALASPSDPAISTLGGAASAYGLARSDWQLFWQWLTQ